MNPGGRQALEFLGGSSRSVRGLVFALGLGAWAWWWTLDTSRGRAPELR